jgi:hypothetical protein
LKRLDNLGKVKQLGASWMTPYLWRVPQGPANPLLPKPVKDLGREGSCCLGASGNSEDRPLAVALPTMPAGKIPSGSDGEAGAESESRSAVWGATWRPSAAQHLTLR